MAFTLGIKGVRELFPSYYLDMLYEIYTPKEVDSILKSYLTGRRTTFRLNRLKLNSEAILDELRKRNIKIDKCNYFDYVYMLREGSEKILQQTEGYKRGYIYLQNLSSIIPAEVLDVSDAENVLDMCAAPGGKTLKLAENMNNKGKILANEVNPIRFNRLRYNIDKLGGNNIEAINLDGRKLMLIYRDYFDRILLDAPCSGEGTIKIMSAKKLKLLKNGPFAKMQKELIVSAFNSLKSGGKMLYSTCTISPQENEEVVNYLLKKFNNADILPIDIGFPNIKEGLIGFKEKVYDERLRKAVRIIPNEFMEGFFMCLIEKK